MVQQIELGISKKLEGGSMAAKFEHLRDELRTAKKEALSAKVYSHFFGQIGVIFFSS